MVNTGFDNLSLCTTVPCGTELQNFSLQEDGIQQVVQAFLLQGADVNKLSVSTPILWYQSQVGKLCLYTVGICLRLINLVYSHDDRYICILGVIDSFNSLGHNTVIGGNHQNNNISNLGTTSTHHGKSFVTRCIQEGNASLFCLYHVGTDVLGNSTELTFCYMGTADGVQGLCLTMVNVTHDGNNGRTNINITFFTSIAFDNSLVVQADDMNITIVLRSQQGGSVCVNGLSDGNHHSHGHELGNDFRSLQVHLLCQIRHGDCLHNLDGSGYCTGRGGLLLLLVSIFKEVLVFPVLAVHRLLSLKGLFGGNLLCFLHGSRSSTTNSTGTWSTEARSSLSTVKAALSTLAALTVKATLTALTTIVATTLAALTTVVTTTLTSLATVVAATLATLTTVVATALTSLAALTTIVATLTVLEAFTSLSTRETTFTALIIAVSMTSVVTATTRLVRKVSSLYVGATRTQLKGSSLWLGLLCSSLISAIVLLLWCGRSFLCR